MCNNLRLIALAIDGNFLGFLASAPWDRGFYLFFCVNIFRHTTSRTSKIMPCKINIIPLSNLK
jgi:hypothetical protein